MKKIMVVLFFFLGSDPMINAARGENPLVEFSSREELVQIAGYGEEKLSTVLIIGQVFCHSCVDERSQLPPHPISGASVAVFCKKSNKRRKSLGAQNITDSYGEFIIDLPSHLHSIPMIEKMCHVHVLHLPNNSLCEPAFTGMRKGIKLSSMENGFRTYTAQIIHLTPQPCNNKEIKLNEVKLHMK